MGSGNKQNAWRKVCEASMKIPLAFVALLLSISSALAGSVIALRSYDDGTVLSFIGSAGPDFDGVKVNALGVAKAPKVIRSTQIQGNQVALKTCLDPACLFNWPRASMRAGSNDISLLVTMTDGSAYITTGTFGRPVAVTPPPTPPAIPRTPGVCYLLDDKGGLLLTADNQPITCN
jgi:hypothetical protein